MPTPNSDKSDTLRHVTATALDSIEFELAHPTNLPEIYESLKVAQPVPGDRESVIGMPFVFTILNGTVNLDDDDRIGQLQQLIGRPDPDQFATAYAVWINYFEDPEWATNTIPPVLLATACRMAMTMEVVTNARAHQVTPEDVLAYLRQRAAGLTMDTSGPAPRLGIPGLFPLPPGWR